MVTLFKGGGDILFGLRTKNALISAQEFLEWDISKVPISNKSTLVAPIVLDVKDEVYADLLVTIRGLTSLAHVLEGVVLMKLGHLKGSGVLSLGVPIALIKLDGMVVVSWDLIAILVAWHHAVGLALGLVSHAKELLVTFGYALELFPTIKI